MTGPTYSIRNWNEFYENSRSRTVKDLSWVPVPNKHDGETFAGIMAAENGAEIYSAWILILQVASKCNPRGRLVKDNGTPHDARSLSIKTRAPEKWFSVALQYLAKETDWLSCDGDGTLSGSYQAPIAIPSGSCQLSAEERREGKGIEGKNGADKPQRPKGFEKPSIEAILMQCAKMGLPEQEGHKFLNHYESNGWRVGKNPMKSWQHALGNWRLNWQGNRLNYGHPANHNQPPAKRTETETDRFVRQQIEDGILRVTADGKIEAVPIEELSKTKP